MLRHKRTYAILILLLFAVSFYSPFYTPTIVSATMQEIFYATKDAFIESNHPNNNYGSVSTFQVKSREVPPVEAFRSFIEYDIGILPSNTEITNATLCFYIFTTLGSETRTYQIQKITNDSWLETGVTWNLQPSLNASVVEHDIDPVIHVWWNVSVTDIVDRHGEGGEDTNDLLGFRIKDEDESHPSSTQLKSFTSRQHDPDTNQSVLILEFAYVDPTPIEVGINNPEGCGYSDYLSLYEDSGLVMYHTLDYPYRYFSNDTAPDDSIDDDALLFGDDDEWYNRPLSWAWDFDGNSSDDIIDYAVVAHSEEISLNNTLTVEAWFRTESSASQTIIHKGNGTIVNYHLWVEDGWVRFNVYDGTDDIFCYQSDTVTIEANDGYWHHVLASWDRNDNATLYLDGLYVNHTVSTINDPVVLDEDCFIGAYNSTYQIFNGTIDEIRLWDRVLNETEITYSYVHGEAHYENWVFVEDHYYDFEAVYQPASGLDTVMISFYDGGINASYDVITEEWDLVVGNNSAGYPYVNLDRGEASVSAENLTVTFPMFFFKTVNDRINQDIYMWCNSTLGTESEWVLRRPDHFNIYNYGGLIRSRIFNPTAVEKIVLGSAWDWKVGPDEDEIAWVQLNSTFRNLQHARWVTSLYSHRDYVDDTIGKGACYAEYMFYACSKENGIWSKQFGVRLNITDWELGWGARAMEFRVEWYNQTDFVANGTIFGYYESSSGINQTKIVVDLWVDFSNGSSVVGGHVNPVYFDKGNWIGAGTGGVYVSQFEETMRDYDGSVMSANDVCLWRVVQMVYKYPKNEGDDQIYYATQDTMFNVLNSAPEGIDHPLWIEPKEYRVGGWGFFEPVRQALIWLGNFLAHAFVWAALNAFNMLVGFMDNIAGYFGYPNLVSTFVTWLVSMWPLVVNSLSWIASFFIYIFLFFGAVFGTFIGILAISVGHYVNMWTMAWSLLHGGYGVVFDFWVQFNMTVWVEIFVILYPAWVLGIMERKGMTGVISHFQQVASIFSFIFSMLMVVINLMINVVSYVIEVIF